MFGILWDNFPKEYPQPLLLNEHAKLSRGHMTEDTSLPAITLLN